MKEVISIMIKNKRGKIINITSGWGSFVMPRFGVYSVSKAAVSHLTRIMAEELKNYNIQVNAVNPGVMDTSMQEQLGNPVRICLGANCIQNLLS